MKLEEAMTKWKTSVVDNVPMVLAVPGRPTVKVPMHRHVAPLGDFIREYIQHLGLSRWRRGPDWNLTERLMREKLNQGSLTWNG